MGRKNAFRLLQLHRFHLAAALFVLGDSMEEAAKVVAGHLRDIQLMVLVTRNCRQVAAPLLLECLEESAFSSVDPWLNFLLAWHAGKTDVATKAASHVHDGQDERALPGKVDTESLTTSAGSDRDVDDGNDGCSRIFDGCMRISRTHVGLAEMANAIAVVPILSK